MLLGTVGIANKPVMTRGLARTKEVMAKEAKKLDLLSQLMTQISCLGNLVGLHSKFILCKGNCALNGHLCDDHVRISGNKKL